MRWLLVLIITVYAHGYEEGKAIYEQSCKICHGAMDGTVVQKRFLVQPRQLNATILNRSQIAQVIAEGSHYWGAYQGVMPEFKRFYDAEAIEAVAAYVDSQNVRGVSRGSHLLKNAYFTADEKNLNGAVLYDTHCARCHGQAGDGKGEATYNPPLTLFPHALRSVILNVDQIFLYAKYGGLFWGMADNAMPHWSEVLHDNEIMAIAKYIKNVLQK